jgi:hypothetical protein
VVLFGGGLFPVPFVALVPLVPLFGGDVLFPVAFPVALVALFGGRLFPPVLLVGLAG